MWEKELQAAIEAGLLAKDKILEIYHQNFEVEIKSDHSPVTLADKTADRIIAQYLKTRFPSYAFLTEESDDNLERLNNDFVWIIDPLDGTKDFVARDGGFTTNIALAYKHELVVGVIIIPVTGEVYFASKGNGSFYQKPGQKPIKIHVNDKISDLTVLTSVFHSNEVEAGLIAKHSDKIKRVEKRGSSIKMCHIAHGLAELTYRMSQGTKEWDTAAGQIIVTEAGGVFIQPDGKQITYNRKDVYNRKGYVVANRIENVLL